MAWVRLDDGFADHPKLAAVGPLGQCLQVRALCYCARHLTDGFLPASVMPALTAGFGRFSVEDGIVGDSAEGPPLASFGHDCDDEDWGAVMTNAGLWEIVPGGYKIHDFLDYNPSRREVIKSRKHNADRQSSWRSRHAVTNQSSNAVSNASLTVPPSPSPSPSPTTKNKKLVVLTDDQFIDSLKSNPAYSGINIDLELGKMDAWLATPAGRRRRKTRQFIVNWLNRIDRPVAALPGGRGTAITDAWKGRAGGEVQL